MHGIKPRTAGFHDKTLSSASQNSQLKVAQILRLPFVAYFTRSSKVNSFLASENQRRGDKDTEKKLTFSSMRHNSNCLARFLSPLFKLPWVFLLLVCSLLLFYTHSSSLQVDAKVVKGENSALHVFISVTEVFIMH